MKTIIYTILSLFFLSCLMPMKASAQHKKYENLFSKECVMLYDVNFEGRDYMFNVRIIENSKKGLIFDWFMTGSAGMTGVVKVSAQDLQSATSYLNYFDYKSNYSIPGTSCVWLSKYVFTKFKNGESIRLVLSDNTAATFKMVHGNTGYIVPVSSRYGDIYGLHAIRIESEDGKYFMYINDDLENPVILYMDLETWYVKLKGIM